MHKRPEKFEKKIENHRALMDSTGSHYRPVELLPVTLRLEYETGRKAQYSATGI